jgi:hypothetical protein
MLDVQLVLCKVDSNNSRSFDAVALRVELLRELTKDLTSEELKKIRGKLIYGCEKSWRDVYSSGF